MTAATVHRHVSGNGPVNVDIRLGGPGRFVIGHALDETADRAGLRPRQTGRARGPTDTHDGYGPGRCPGPGGTMTHTYETVVTWTGNRGTGTSGYREYGREHEVTADGPAPLAGSADPAFRGDPARWNPEQLLVAALAQCHLLSYLALCARHGVVVTGYADRARGTMAQQGNGGHFTSVVLRPAVRVASAAMVEQALALHHEAHESCFIASSVNFPVSHEPTVTAEQG